MHRQTVDLGNCRPRRAGKHHVTPWRVAVCLTVLLIACQPTDVLATAVLEASDVSCSRTATSTVRSNHTAPADALTTAPDPTFCGWTLEEGKLKDIGFAAAAVLLGRYIFVVGGVHEVPHEMGLPDLIRRYTSYAINAFDFAQGTIRLAMQLTSPPDAVPVREAARLRLPVVGANSVVELGSGAYFFGCCNIIPNNVVVGDSLAAGAADADRALVDRYLRSVQRMYLVQTAFPERDDVTVRLEDWSLPEDMPLRFNASCVAGKHGDVVYIVGGVNALTGAQLSSVAQYNVLTHKFVDAVWSLEAPVVTPAAAAHGELVYLAGGFFTSGFFLPSLETSQGVALLDAEREVFVQHAGAYWHRSLGWTTPQLFGYGRSLILSGSTDGVSYNKLVVWPDMSQPGRRRGATKDERFVLLDAYFAPQRRAAVLAAVPRARDTKLFLFGGQVPPPSGSGSGAVADMFSGTLVSNTSAPRVELLGFSYRQTLDAAELHSGPVGEQQHDELHQRTRVSAPLSSPPPPIPNNEGNTRVLVNGYVPVWYNVSFRLLMSADLVKLCPGITADDDDGGNRSTTTSPPYLREERASPCRLTLSLSPQCHVPVATFGRLGPHNAKPTRVSRYDGDGNPYRTEEALAVGEVMLIGSLQDGLLYVMYADDPPPSWSTFATRDLNKEGEAPNAGIRVFPVRREQARASGEDAPTARSTGDASSSNHNCEHSSSGSSSSSEGSPPPQYYPQIMLYVCFSTGSSAVATRGADDLNGEPQCHSSFFVTLNGDQPFVLSPMTSWTPNHPQPSPQPSADPSRRRLVRSPVVLALGLVGLLLAVVAVAWLGLLKGCRSWGGRGKVAEAEARGLLADDDDEARWPEDEVGAGAAHMPRDAPEDLPARRGAAVPPRLRHTLLDGKYRIKRRLGKGSFSVVYLVERVADGRRLALKYVQCMDDLDRREAIRECDVAYALQGHPNVVTLVDMFMSYKFDRHLQRDMMSAGVGVGDGGGDEAEPLAMIRIDDPPSVPPLATAATDAQPMPRCGVRQGERYLSLVMAYYPDGDLGRWVRRHKDGPPIPEATIVGIAFQVLSVLHFMHSRTPPIIHRDLKPENILLNPAASFAGVSRDFLPVVVTDFGLSRVMDKTFCETGVGSLPYVAPECWQRHYSTKVDLWALGCIVTAVCTKRVEGSNVRVMFSESARPDFAVKLRRELVEGCGYSTALATFILSLLAVDPARRPSATAALRMFRKRRLTPQGCTGTGREDGEPAMTLVCVVEEPSAAADDVRPSGAAGDGDLNEVLEPHAAGCEGRPADSTRSGASAAAVPAVSSPQGRLPRAESFSSAPSFSEVSGDATGHLLISARRPQSAQRHIADA